MRMLLVNLKAYDEGIGANAVRIAKAAAKVAEKENVRVVISPQHVDVAAVAATGAETFAQHIDAVEPGSRTGWILPLAVKKAGATGTLINHSEHRIPMEDIGKRVTAARNAGLVSVCCAATPKEAGEIAKFLPDFIAIEPPELIGGDVSVSTANPGIITDTVKAVRAVKKIPVLCGAGVKDRNDVKKAVELGSEGILVASGVVKSKDPEKSIRDMALGLK